ncbi:hypothetical protein F0227_04310 [Vibrio sp. 99-8-1]|nr:hypothetical protein [Vibrio sp. 99-8-1]
MKITLSKSENEKENVVESIKVISGDHELCEQSVIAIEQVEVLPAPKNQKVRDSLLDINLTLSP